MPDQRHAVKCKNQYGSTEVCEARRRLLLPLGRRVERAAAPAKLRRNAPDSIPVSTIGRLAVDRGHAGRGLGADILADALRRIALAAQSIGIAAVLVQAKDDQAKGFYLACAEFLEFPADSRTLFLPIETVVAALVD